MSGFHNLSTRNTTKIQQFSNILHEKILKYFHIPIFTFRANPIQWEKAERIKSFSWLNLHNWKEQRVYNIAGKIIAFYTVRKQWFNSTLWGSKKHFVFQILLSPSQQITSRIYILIILKAVHTVRLRLRLFHRNKWVVLNSM